MTLTLSRRCVPLGALLTVALLVLAACGSAPNRTEGHQGQYVDEIPLQDDFDPEAHFDYAYSVATSSWDPTQSVSGYDFVFLAPVYDRLVWSSPNGDLEPMLATSWTPTADGTAVDLTLREGVTFSDGTPFNAEAVKINLDRAVGEGSRIATEIAQLESVEIIDEYTVRLVAPTGAGALVGSLSQRAGMMASPAAIESGTLGQQPVGAGVYVVTETVAANYTDFAKREGYWDPSVQRVATMTFQLMTDDQTRLNALLSGQVDGASVRAFQMNAADRAGFNMVSRPTSLFAYLTVNSAQAPFDNPLVLEALNYAIDREAIGNGFYEGMCRPQIQPWPEDSFAYSDEIGDGLDVWAYDPEKARALLADAGYPDGIEMTAVTTNVTAYMQLSEAIQYQLGQVGIDMTIQAVPTPQVIETFSVQKSVQANINPYSGVADPHGVASRHLLPGATYDVGAPVSQQITDLALQAATPVDPQERAPLYAQMMQAMIDNPTHLMPICSLYAIDAFSDNVSSVSMNTLGMQDLRGVALS
ncbi:hypothetical protein EK0264_04910 [Epidermidibacterium keratini]|uniref:Solute-binding protein family 5 domain-containing protein n=1 Tax=Epidermidibacterium keratini TaxID=1891644 RepID=A0A7L4YKV6_9ACTN|nr:ABC transporter substrate-binding protein [Epidermidibacterium keratini]QHB99691.1 hypothetical protein EK0264_04910 [Epidermidibacterium keratini]